MPDVRTVTVCLPKTANIHQIPAAYCTYGLLQAVPADTMLTTDGRLLAPISLRYPDQLDYLRSANDHLNTLADTAVLVAVTTE